MTNNSKTPQSIAQKEMVTRPALWGFVILLVSFGFVMLVTSLYKMYMSNNSLEIEYMTSDSIQTTNSTIDTNINENADTSTQVNTIEQEVSELDQDLENDLTDETLGL
jgi:hypothetical protein